MSGTCPTCGAVVPEGTSVCDRCGSCPSIPRGRASAGRWGQPYCNLVRFCGTLLLLSSLISLLMMAAYFEAVYLPYDPTNTDHVGHTPNYSYLPTALKYLVVGVMGLIATVLLLMDKQLRFGLLTAFLLFLSPFLNTEGFVHLPLIFGTFGATLGIFLFSLVAMVVLWTVMQERRRIRQAQIALMAYAHQLHPPNYYGYVTADNREPMDPRWGAL